MFNDIHVCVCSKSINGGKYQTDSYDRMRELWEIYISLTLRFILYVWNHYDYWNLKASSVDIKRLEVNIQLGSIIFFLLVWTRFM